jgi:superfamily II DNA/RNA helicase
VADANGVALGGLRLSSKLLTALELLMAKPAGEKAIVFSWFKGALDVLEGVLVARLHKMSCERIDGDLDARERRAVLDRFGRPDCAADVLLMTLSTGGVGLNITAANHCIFLDPWWNPAVIEQAIDRTHRIGQRKPVQVHLLYAKDTFDEVIRDIAAHKAGAAQALLGDKEGQVMLGGRDALESSGLSGRDYKGLLSGIQEVRSRRAAARGMDGMGGVSGDGSSRNGDGSGVTSGGAYPAATASGGRTPRMPGSGLPEERFKLEEDNDDDGPLEGEGQLNNADGHVEDEQRGYNDEDEQRGYNDITRDAEEGSFVTSTEGRGDDRPVVEGPVVIDLTDD